MLVKTQGIVIHYLKYRETSIIVKIFTRELGLKSYLVNGVRSAKSKSKMAFYQPLTLVDLVVYDKENASLNRISEVKLDHAFQLIPFDFYRTGIAMFMGEVLSKAIYESYQNEFLFDFLHQSIVLLDQDHINLGNFPLAFLLETSRFLGFAPDNALEFFEQVHEKSPSQSIILEEKKYLSGLMNDAFSPSLKIPGAVRRQLLNDMLRFYRINLENFPEIKSLHVLRNLM